MSTTSTTTAAPDSPEDGFNAGVADAVSGVLLAALEREPEVVAALIAEFMMCSPAEALAALRLLAAGGRALDALTAFGLSPAASETALVLLKDGADPIAAVTAARAIEA